MKRIALWLLAAICVMTCLYGCKKIDNGEEPSSTVTQANTDYEVSSEETSSSQVPTAESQLVVTVIESTPESVIIEVDDGQNEDSIQAEIGVTKGEAESGAADDGSAAVESTKPSESSPTVSAPIEPDPTIPTPSEHPSTNIPSQGGADVGPDINTTFEEYEAMSGVEQTLFFYSFSDADAFYAWYNAAKAEYEAGKDDIIIGDDGSVDVGGSK